MDFTKWLPGENRQWRLVVSPGEPFLVGNELFIWEFMRRLAQRAGKSCQGQEFDWCAVLHTNTPHPHWHVVIRGLDKEGEDVRFRKSIFKNLRSLANRVQYDLTHGTTLPRWIVDERRAVSLTPDSELATVLSLDWVIAASAGKTRDEVLSSVDTYRRKALHERMTHLENAGVITRQDSGVIVFPVPFFKAMRRVNRLLSLLESQNLPLYNTGNQISLHDSRMKPKSNTRGLVTSRIVIPDKPPKMFLVLESIDGRITFVRVESAVHEEIANGDYVIVSAKGVRPLHRRGSPIVPKDNGPVALAIREGLPGLISDIRVIDIKSPKTERALEHVEQMPARPLDRSKAQDIGRGFER